MCEITKYNFEDWFPTIEEAIRNATFVAIDSEFTGLTVSDKDKYSLFDSGEERYQKLKFGISQFIPNQFGLSVYTKIESENAYEAKSFNFYLYPCTFGPVDVRFSCQASSLHFLCKHNFDFNKFVYDGISFLNGSQEQQLKEYLQNKEHLVGLERDVDEHALQRCCSLVADWLSKAEDNATFTLDQMDCQGLGPYDVITEVRERFPEVWAFQEQNKASGNQAQVVCQKMSVEEKQKLYEEMHLDEEERILREKVGFSRVFHLLAEHKKPIVGHNCLMDLMLVYDKFINPLPDTLVKFKSQMLVKFPVIYDTKTICARLRRTFESTGYFEVPNLGELYLKLNSQEAKYHYLFSPTIEHHEGYDRYRGEHCPHEAAYDAFMTGSVFLRMAHLVALMGITSTKAKPQTFAQYQAALEEHCNRINVIRASMDHINFAGEDPASRRPEWLFVRSRLLSEPLHTAQLARLFSPYGSVDIRMRNQRQALVAVATFRSSRDILKNFRHHRSLYVAKYSVWKHSPYFRGFLMTSVAVTGGLCAWLLYRETGSSHS